MKKLLLLAVLGAVTLLGSCIRPEKLSFEGIESIQVKGATASQVGIDLGIKATNASGSNLTLTDMQLTISKEGRRIVDIVLRDKARKSSGVMTLPLAIRFDGPLGALGVYSAFSKGLQNTTLSGYVTARAGWGKKKIEIPEMPLDQMARQFGFDPAELLKNM
jgi:hypothetical protein